MGKGDKKTRKGKIFLGSYGKVRPRKTGSTYKVEKATEDKKES
ncbi:MAG TPA: 30S ribosomal protein THX [Microscillaceae bacterium]|nr:30S ribosomal protein THX [Microscillaceae bacterium]